MYILIINILNNYIKNIKKNQKIINKYIYIYLKNQKNNILIWI